MFTPLSGLRISVSLQHHEGREGSGPGTSPSTARTASRADYDFCTSLDWRYSLYRSYYPSLCLNMISESVYTVEYMVQWFRDSLKVGRSCPAGSGRGPGSLRAGQNFPFRTTTIISSLTIDAFSSLRPCVIYILPTLVLSPCCCESAVDANPERYAEAVRSHLDGIATFVGRSSTAREDSLQCPNADILLLLHIIMSRKPHSTAPSFWYH